MSTIVNNPAERERIIEKSDNGGWAVAVIVLLAVLAIGGFLWMRYMNVPAATTTDSNTPGSANINITLPADNTGGSNSSDTSGGANEPAPNPAQ